MLRAIAVLLTGAFLLAGCSRSSTFKSVDVTGADWGKTLALTGHDGKPRTLADFKGKIVVLTFGFTNCPDICPTTLADIAQARRSLPATQANQVQVLFVTLDPERDTRAVLAEYVPAFDRTFIGLSGDEDAIRRTAQEFKIAYQKSKSTSGSGYAVDHSTQSYVLDAEGRLRLLVGHKRLADDLAHDLKALFDQPARAQG
jgi:protein SCO1/2